jgi:hypothetical protein
MSDDNEKCSSESSASCELIPELPPATAASSAAGSVVVSRSGRKRRRNQANESYVWIFFKRETDPNGKVTKSRMQCPTKFGRSTGNSTLMLHLDKKHGIKRGKKTGDYLQRTIKTDGTLHDPYELDDQTRAEIMESLVDFIVDNKQPFNLVESASFRDFARKLNPHYKIPSRATIVRALPEFYDQVLGRFRSMIESIEGRVALTLDGWSSRVMRGYFVITMHWINDTWDLKSAVLEFKYFPPPHNQETTFDLIINVLKDYNVSSRVKAITSDSGPEMPGAMRRVRDALNAEFKLYLNEDYHVRCVCHVINRAVVNATAVIKKEVEMLREILNSIRGSTAMRQKFSQLAVVLGISKSRLEVPNLDVETRWNSTYTMIENCFKFKAVFQAMCNTDDFHDRLARNSLDDVQWGVLQACKDFLVAAYQYTVSASGRNYVSLSLQPLIYIRLIELCDKTEHGNLASRFTTSVVRKAAQDMRSKLEKYSSNMNSMQAKIALLLDPRTGNSSRGMQLLKDHVRNILRTEYDMAIPQQAE